MLNCYYCDSLPENCRKVKNNNEIFLYTGIDRINNDLGYFKENCVPSCIKCNRGKMDRSLDEFLKWVIDIHNNSKKIREI